jgi:hypothetical protein
MSRAMKKQFGTVASAVGLVCLLAAAGCSGGPSALTAPSIDADDAAAQAMELFDKNNDETLDETELKAAPGLQASMATLDGDKDGTVSAQEITDRINAWAATGIGLTTASPLVTLDGQPLAGAKVTFEPEPFLADYLKTATGETNDMGTVSVTIPKEQREPADAPPGLTLGFYRVRISKEVGGKETIPAVYNTETTLGQQIAPDDPAVAGQRLRFQLTSK